MKKDYLILIGGFLGAAKVLLASFGYDIITQEQIDAIVNIVGFGLTGYAIWKNTHVSKKGQEQKKVLEENNLL
ncbi:phage holin [Priestia flexa]|uniref:phage holin n=1 Tax=Priestia flexa TaxID=86664 RepID=UPI0005565235|nr:phage holin [Priestia flexa]